MLLAASLVASFVFGFRPEVEPVEPGLDSSYVYAAGYASLRGWRFGTDFVSTYGPYSYLLHAPDLETIPVQRWKAEWLLVILAGASCALHALSGPATTRRAALGASVLLTYLIHLQEPDYRWFLPVLLLLLLSLHGKEGIRILAFSLAAVLAGFFLLVKVSLGIGSSLTLGAGCLLSGSARAAAGRLGLLVVGASSGFATGWWAHQGSFSGALEFLSVARSVTHGYSSAMSLSSPGWEATAAAYLYFVLVLGGWSFASGKRRSMVTFLACVVPLFLAWKHLMVRQDEGHMSYVVMFGVFMVGLLWNESLDMSWRAGAALVAASVPALFAPWFLPQTYDVTRTPQSLLHALAVPLRGRPVPMPSDIGWMRLGEGLRDRVGRASIDVYPFETLYPAANDFVWKNRPSPFSFASYTPELDRLNARFLSSSRRPRFLLWHPETEVNSIDGRHVFWDEPETLRTILSTYRMVQTDRALLLEARRGPILSEPRHVRLVEARWGEWIPVPETGGALLAAVHFERPPSAWWRRILLREDPTFVSIRFDSGGDRIYRFLPDQASSGLWMSPLPRTIPELRRLFRGNLSRPRPRAIRFDGARGSFAGRPFFLIWRRLAVRSST